MGCIYLLWNDREQKGYVGQTSRTLHGRWRQHLIDARRRPRMAVHKAMAIDEFVVCLLEECACEVLDEREQFWIDSLGTFFPNGYNRKRGGANGTFDPEMRQHISQAKAHFWSNPKNCARMSRAQARSWKKGAQGRGGPRRIPTPPAGLTVKELMVRLSISRASAYRLLAGRPTT